MSRKSLLFNSSIVLGLFLISVITSAQVSNKQETGNSSKSKSGDINLLRSTEDNVYNNSGDPNKLMKGSYRTTDLDKHIRNNLPLDNPAKTGGNNIFLGDGIFRVKANRKGYTIDRHNTYLTGQGPGVTSIHFEASGGTDEIAFAFSKPNSESDRLIRGGGMKNLTLKTNNENIIDFGLQFDYTEYMELQNVNFENFQKSAVMGCFWESYFQNVTIRSSGAGITSGPDGTPTYGVFDFDSHSAVGNRDACNNTNINKLTFSSCFGTHIRAVAHANSIVNINIYGLYDETYAGDGGAVDNLPIYFFKGVKNFHVTGGFLTVNPTGTNRHGSAIRIANDSRNGQISFSNFELLQNHGGGSFTANTTNRLDCFIYLETNQRIALTNVSINDASGSVGIGKSSRYLIDGEKGSSIYLNNVLFSVKKGVWDITNLINPDIKAQGNITIQYFNDKGPTGEMNFHQFQ